MVQERVVAMETVEAELERLAIAVTNSGDAATAALGAGATDVDRDRVRATVEADAHARALPTSLRRIFNLLDARVSHMGAADIARPCLVDRPGGATHVVLERSVAAYCAGDEMFMQGAVNDGASAAFHSNVRRSRSSCRSLSPHPLVKR